MPSLPRKSSCFQGAASFARSAGHMQTPVLRKHRTPHQYMSEGVASSLARHLQEKNQDTRSKLDSNAAPFADKNLSEGDKANIRTLSDALNLNEELCVELLLRAHTESRPVTVEHAAHIYFDERSSLLQAFIRMLHIHLGYMDTSEPACKDLVEQALQILTKQSSENSSSKTKPLARLCAIVKVRHPRRTICRSAASCLRNITTSLLTCRRVLVLPSCSPHRCWPYNECIPAVDRSAILPLTAVNAGQA